MVRAGIGSGMRVLELGSGAGDVALLVGSLVGDSGAVLGVDRAAESVAAATARVAQAGLKQVRFITGSIEALDLREKFDAIVGRLVLMYLKDPSATLAALARQFLKPGGALVFMELDMESARQVPPVALVAEAVGRIRETFRRAGNQINLGPRLPQVFRAAGLPDPQLIARTRLEAAPALECTRYTSATIRSLLPVMEQLGVARAEEVQVDTLAERMQQALTAANATMIMPSMIGAWARMPGG
ncbi:MAG TPA: methyltransferase domain-containing protein [Steroidobacteraceae bacterium]|nr:methyltransferase domain-containing protein [Steroidobacteraceae bacterium]